MKYLKWIVLSVILLIVIAVFVIFMNIDSLVRRTVETQASSSLNLPVSLGGANVSLFGGSLSLRDLEIASPKGFKADHMFTLGGTKVGVTYGKLRENPITIDQVVIDKPKIVVEQANGKFNFQAVMDQQSKAPPDNSEPLRLIISDVAVNDAQVVFRPGIPGLNSEIAVNVAPLHLKNIGSGEGNKNGAAMKDVVMAVLTAVVEKASESDVLPKEVRELLNLNVGKVAEQLQKEIGARLEKEIGKAIPGDIGKDAGKAIEKGLGGILNKEEKKAK